MPPEGEPPGNVVAESGPPGNVAPESGPQVTVIPVTVIGGYLGAGKTTLLNHLLTTVATAAPGPEGGAERLAVLVNDFGEINIDAGLIESHDGETMTLTNGCICCSMVDGLAAALDQVLALSPRPDRLVIEASGVADPGTVAGYCHAPGLYLDAVVVVVDIETVQAKVADRYVGDVVAGQLAAADIVVLNKIDLVESTIVEQVTAWLNRYSPDALVLPTRHGTVAPELLFGFAERTPTDAASVRGSENPHGRHGSEATGRFQTWTWSSDEPVERASIERLMASIPDDVWRVKGIVRLVGDDRRAWVLQRVGRRWSLRPITGVDSTGVVTSCRVVAIGREGAITGSRLIDILG